MRFTQVSEILNAVASEADIVGLAIAEYLPWSVIEFAKALDTLPLLGSPEKASRPSMVKEVEWIEMAQLAVSSILFKSLWLKLP